MIAHLTAAMAASMGSAVAAESGTVEGGTVEGGSTPLVVEAGAVAADITMAGVAAGLAAVAAHEP